MHLPSRPRLGKSNCGGRGGYGDWLYSEPDTVALGTPDLDDMPIMSELSGTLWLLLVNELLGQENNLRVGNNQTQSRIKPRGKV